MQGRQCNVIQFGRTASILLPVCCRERVLSSLSLYELARRFWQQRDYERSLVAVEQSIYHKLFPYQEPRLLGRWVKSLVSPGAVFRRPKLELADALILRANCLYELGRRDSSIEHLYQALEATHLSAALMHSSMGSTVRCVVCSALPTGTLPHFIDRADPLCMQDLVPEVLTHLESLSVHVGMTVAEVLTKMTTAHLAELMGE